MCSCVYACLSLCLAHNYIRQDAAHKTIVTLNLLNPYWNSKQTSCSLMTLTVVAMEPQRKISNQLNSTINPLWGQASCTLTVIPLIKDISPHCNKALSLEVTTGHLHQSSSADKTQLERTLFTVLLWLPQSLRCLVWWQYSTCRIGSSPLWLCPGEGVTDDGWNGLTWVKSI